MRKILTKIKNGSIALALLSVFGFVTPAFAGNYVLFVHGKGGDSSGLSDTNASRWGNSDSYGPASKTRSSSAWATRFVNYDSRYDPRTSGTTRAQTKLTNAINTYCSGSNKCVVVCHSAGCYATEYFFATKTAPSGLLYVVAGASAAGGSSVADIGTNATLIAPFLALIGWAVAGEPNSMTISLRTGTARSFNHNLSPVSIYSLAGHKSSQPAATAIKGEDDKLVNFSGACGYNKHGSMTNCNDGSNAKYTRHVSYCNSKGATVCNTSKGSGAYNQDHSGMQPVARDALDRLLGYL